MTVLLVSYIPFLVGDPLAGDITVEQVQTMLEESPESAAICCIWASRNGKPSPVFVYDHANEMYEHLVAWAENKPVDWFNLHLATKGSKYVIALIPNHQKSIERWRIAYQIRVGFPPPEAIHYNILFRSPFFVSTSANTFQQVRSQIGADLEIGFLDSSLINPDDIMGSLQKLEDSQIKWLGPFKISSNQDMQEYLDKILDDSKDPGGTTV